MIVSTFFIHKKIFYEENNTLVMYKLRQSRNFGVVLNKGIIKKFQVIQEKKDYIINKLVLDNKESFLKNKKDFDEITDKIKLVMGNSKEINFILVDYILPIKSGKYRYTISKVYQ